MIRNVGSSFCVGHNNEALILLILYQYIRRMTRLDSQKSKVTPEWRPCYFGMYCCDFDLEKSMMTYGGKTTWEAAD